MIIHITLIINNKSMVIAMSKDLLIDIIFPRFLCLSIHVSIVFEYHYVNTKILVLLLGGDFYNDFLPND